MFYTDLHLHSHYSRATSKNLDLEHLNLWGQIKGIDIAGTGDFTHPAWFKELKEKLEPAEEGLFKLKNKFIKTTQSQCPKSCQADVRFLLTVEISNIYKRHDKVRKVHNVVCAPSFQAAEKIIARLDKIGNLKSDGRPILGLDSRNLLEIVLESDPLSYLIPAHIWTPWFSVLGSKGGFNSLEEAFGDLTDQIFALETGLSSDPLMNWRLSQLDKCVLVSNGDAHSPPKLGREATIFDCDMSYNAIYNALKYPQKNKGLIGTIEFYPEEGKYHYDGCRNCEQRLHPRQTIELNGKCPGCGKAVTVGVMARVEELADHREGRKSPNSRPYYSLIPLTEIIGDAKGMGQASQAVQTLYFEMLNRLGNEIYILRECPLERIQQSFGDKIAEGIDRVRTGKVEIAAGYDGEYGKIKIFSSQEREIVKEQLTLF